MSAGTITLTHGSDAVTGTGTTFTTDLVAGDFVVATVGGITYTLPVAAVSSGTALTLIKKYTGPTQANAAWNAVPRAIQNQVTAELVVQSTEYLRSLNYDKANWQAVFSASGDITVLLPDGSTFTGPSWKELVTLLGDKASNESLNEKASKGANSDITSLSGLTTALSIEQGGTGAKTAADARSKLGLKGAAVLDVGNVANTVAAGNDSRLNTVDGKDGGNLSSPITVRGAGLAPKLVASHLDYIPAQGGNAVWIVGMTATENIMQYVTEVTGQYYSLTTVWRVAGQQQFWSQTSTGRYVTPLGELAVQGSDVRIKYGFHPPKEGAWGRVERMGICEFMYNGSGIPQRGFLAQQMGEIDPLYVFESGTSEDEDGNEFNILNVNERAVLADMITVIQTLQQKVKALEEQSASK